MEETTNNLLFVDRGIGLFLNINRMVGILVPITTNCSNLQNGAKLEVNYHLPPIGRPVVASAAISAMFDHLLRNNGKEDVLNRAFEPMVRTLLSLVPNRFDPPGTNEEDPEVFENPEKRDGKRTVKNPTPGKEKVDETSIIYRIYRVPGREHRLV